MSIRAAAPGLSGRSADGIGILPDDMKPRGRLIAVLLLKWVYFWQCAQVPVISTTDSFGAKPVARAAALRLCATGAAGISPTEPQCSQIRNATIAAASWSWAQARNALRLSMRW